MILITGSSGQLGSYLRDFYTDSIGLDKKGSKYTDIVGDIRDFGSVKGYDVDTIIHCAAEISVVESVEKPDYYIDVNLMGTVELLEYARKNDVDKFVFISSAAVYGVPKYLPVDEKHPTEPLSPYGVSKLMAEKAVQMYGELYGIQTRIIRPFNIFSPRQDPENAYSGVISIFVKRAKSGQPLIIYGDGKQTRDFISAEDVVRCIDAVSEKGKRDVYNCGTGTLTTVNALAETIIRLSGSDSELIHQEPRAGEIRDSYANVDKVRSLGFEPAASLEEYLKTYFFT